MEQGCGVESALHCMSQVVKLVEIKLDSLRLWLSFFCLSFMSALASESEKKKS